MASRRLAPVKLAANAETVKIKSMKILSGSKGETKMRALFIILLIISFSFVPATAPAQQSNAQKRAGEIAASFNKLKDKLKGKPGSKQERYYRRIESQPAVKQDVKTYSGVYEMPGLDFTIALQVGNDGKATAGGFESATGSRIRQARRFKLENAQIENSLLTGTKVYEDGTTEKFEGVFMNRTTFTSPTDTGETVFGLGVVGVSVDFAGIVFEKLFYELKAGNPTSDDKSKTVRKAIEAWYEQNIKAFRKKDAAAIMALRAADFHTVLPDGRKNTRADMQAYTERLLGMIEKFETLDFQIGAIELQERFGDAPGEFASALVTQKTVRTQRLPDGQIHTVESGAVQRETWKKTPEGWKLYRVDNIRDAGLYIDGNLVRRPQ